MSTEEVDDLVRRANVSALTHLSGQGKVFLSAGYNRLPSEVREKNGPLPLLAHGVVNECSQEERDAVVVFMNPHLGYKDYVTPARHETGLDDLYAHLESVTPNLFRAASTPTN